MIPVNLYSSLASLPRVPEGTRVRDLRDPELRPHLRGLAGYLLQGVAPGRPPTRSVAQAVEFTWKVKHHLVVFTPEDALDQAFGLARTLNALVFLPDGTLRNPSGEVLGGPGASGQAAPPALPDALARRQRTQAALAARGIRVPESLPPAWADEEALLPPAERLLGRIRGLVATGVRAESQREGRPIPREELLGRLPGALLTPREEKLLAGEASPQEVVQLGWRYEALTALMWAGNAGELPFPSAIAEVGPLVRAALGLQAVTLRPIPEVLDSLDLHYRLHWFVRDHQVKGLSAPGVEAGVVVERRTALSWLVGLGGFPWDEIQLPT